MAVVKEKRLISFAPSTLKFLKREAKKLEISVSELLRRIVDGWREARR